MEPIRNADDQGDLNSQETPQPPDGLGQDTVWSYRGYQLRPGEFNTALVHLYRGEVARANVWRQRLDATTNWAVIVTGPPSRWPLLRGLATTASLF